MKSKKFTLTARYNMKGYFFIIPFIVGFFVIFLPCVIESLIYSFNDVKIDFGGVIRTFVGIKNYYDAFLTDTEFRVVLLSALKGILIDTLLIIMFSFFIANVLNQKFVGRSLARAVFFLPVILTTGIVESVERSNAMYNAMESVIGTAEEETAIAIFDQLGLAVSFRLQNMFANLELNPSIINTVIYALTNTYNIANSSGVQILIFLSALQTIPPSLFEASKIEGATKWEEFWKITFPLLTPMVFVNIVYTVIDTFTNPVYAVLDYIYNVAFIKGKMGLASALSWIYFTIIILVLGMVSLVVSRRITYLD